MKYAAVYEFTSITPADKTDEQRLQQASDRINETLDIYLDSDRIESPTVFEGDAEAVQHLASVSSTDPERVNETTWLLAQSNARTANVSITDTERALEQFEGDLDDPGHRNAIDDHLQNAKQAYERGETALETDTNGDVTQASHDRSRAIREYMTAWREAQQALDLIQRETTPQVTITTRGDPQRNGTAPLTGEIRGTVFDARPHELPNATVTVGDNETKTVPLETSSRGLTATFATNATLHDRITSVDVEVPDTRPHGDPDPSRASNDTVLFDGDALPDTYERTVVETDPQDPDSDSPRVDADVGDNDVIDGLESFDNDTLSNYHEGRFGSDPFATDSDGDGLPDHFEVEYPQLDQTSADTTDDGVDDSEWDLDDDGLTNLEEYEAETNPQLADQDRDGLEDDRELEVGTDPEDPDTDDDGLDDGEELELGTDPLAADSAGDGIDDGNRSYTTETSNESLGVDIAITGDGNVASGVTIDANDEEQFETDAIASARASPVIELESDREFDSANVTVEYNETAVDEDDAEQLALFRFNETTQTFEPLPSTVDPETGTVTGETTQFSTFAVFHVENWISQFETDEPDDGTSGDETSETMPVDTLFVIDTSGSMGSNDPSGYRKVASKRFVGALIDGDRAGVVDFDGNAHVEQGLTTDFDAVNSSIDRLDAAGGTDIGDGMREANSHFASASNDSRAKITIFLTDGNGDGGPAEAETAAEQNITVYTIGFGSVDDNKLETMAQTTGGEYNYVGNSDELPEVFSRVAENATGATDTDGDGLPDAVEQQGIKTGTGKTLETEWDDNDTDGDGLEDGEEVTEWTTVELDAGGPVLGHYTYYRLDTDPTDADSDDDGIDDYTETTDSTTVVRTTDRDATIQALETDGDSAAIDDAYETDDAYSNPSIRDTDGDGIDDARERELATDPSDRDTDGDGIDDLTDLEGEGDPTLYDVLPPTIDVDEQNSGYHIPEYSLSTTYQVNFYVEDPAGVDRVALTKDGSEHESKSYDSQESVDDYLEFTEEFADSDTNVDTSSWKSTFTSSFKKTAETTGSVTGSVGDILAGTTVNVEARDHNGNEDDAVAIARANFYSEIAGDLDMGETTNSLLANEFAIISGFSASLGVSAQEISEFIDEPTAIINGIEALLALAKEEGFGTAQTLVELMVQDAEQTQDRNNPFDPDEELYSTFRMNWYGGYLSGFLAKMALGGAASGSAKATLKSTDAAQSAGAKLADTRALKALNRISDAKNAAKGRATARILLAVDGDAAEPLLSQADTAGGVYRLWRHQRAMDVDVDALAETKQGDLGRLLSRTGGDGQQTYDDLAAVDSNAADALLEIDDLTTQYRFIRAHQNGNLETDDLSTLVTRYDDLDPDEKALAQQSIIRSGNDGVRLLEPTICNSPCKSVFKSVNQYRGDGLTNTQAKQLLQAYTKADNTDIGPGSRQSANDIQSKIEELDDAEVQGVRDTMASVSGSNSGFRQISGEVDVAYRIQTGENINGQNIRMQKESSNIDGAPNSKTEIDVKVNGEALISGETYQSPAIESKHWNPEKWPPENIGIEPSWDTQMEDLRHKLVTQAVDGEDNLIVVLPDETVNRHKGRFDELVKETKQDLEANDEVNADEIQIEYTSYEEIGQ